MKPGRERFLDEKLFPRSASARQGEGEFNLEAQRRAETKRPNITKSLIQKITNRHLRDSLAHESPPILP